MSKIVIQVKGSSSSSSSVKKYNGTSAPYKHPRFEVCIYKKDVKNMGGIVEEGDRYSSPIRRVFSLTCQHNEELSALIHDLVILQLCKFYEEQNPSEEELARFKNKMHPNFNLEAMNVEIPAWLRQMVRDRLDGKNGSEYRVSVQPIEIGGVTIKDEPGSPQLDRYLLDQSRKNGLSCMDAKLAPRGIKRKIAAPTTPIAVAKRPRESSAASAASSHNAEQPSSSSSSSSSYVSPLRFMLPQWQPAPLPVTVSLGRESPENALFRAFDEFKEAISKENIAIAQYKDFASLPIFLIMKARLLETIDTQIKSRRAKMQAFSNALRGTSGPRLEAFKEARTRIISQVLELTKEADARWQEFQSSIQPNLAQSMRAFPP